MKQYLTPQNIFVVIVFIYLVFSFERYLKINTDHTDSLVEYQNDKLEMQETIGILEKKINNYEVQIIQNNIDILNMSSSERDSARALLNPR